MLNKFRSRSWFAVAALLGILLLLIAPQPAASQATISANEPTCLHCHEDLYYLHDADKWFCVSESPMQCVGCHGGDPTATTQEAAHQNRTAHPIINGDTTTCQQCHAGDYNDRVSKFDAIAGISPVVLVSTPRGPMPAASSAVTPMPQAAKEATPAWDWPVVFAIVVLAFGGAVLWWGRSHQG